MEKDDGSREHVIQKVAEAKLKDQNSNVIPQADAWGTFCLELTKDLKDGAYGVFAIDYETKDGRPSDGLVFVKFLQEVGTDRSKMASVQTKMLYGATMQSFKGQLDATFVFTLEANDKAELDLDAVLTRLSK